MLYILHNGVIEWDCKKNRINQLKHGGIAFETAALFFNELYTDIAWRMKMAKKKPSASSRPEKLKSVSAESKFSRPLSEKQKAVLSRIAKRQAAGDDSGIDYSDIPPLTDKQLAQFRLTPKVLVAARIDREVYDWLLQYGKGYSTRINSILRTVMERAR